MNTKSKPHAPFHRALMRWYAAHGRRDLPWRHTPDPYTVYVSETMLQQTQVKTVLERFFTPFMTRFPDLQTLAAAEQQEVLKAWQGLGYYTRARNLHKTAHITSPALPDSLDGLLALPGIGRNTAHAILAFGYRQPYAVMEANVKRVLCRMFALETPTPSQLWEKADALLNRDDPFDYNQAMMDVGALICTPKVPACTECPAAAWCKGKHHPERYPASKAAKTIPTRKRRMVLMEDDAGRIYAAPRTTRFLGGLYGFVELDADTPTLTHHRRRYPLTHKLGDVSHTYSHFRLEAEVFAVQVQGIANEPYWHPRAEIKALPLSKADEKALELLSLCSGQPAPQKKAGQKRR